MFLISVIFIGVFAAFMIYRYRTNTSIIIINILGLISLFIGSTYMYDYLYQNYVLYPNCGIDPNCMNETGMLFLFGGFFIFIAIILLFIGLISKRNVKEESYDGKKV